MCPGILVHQSTDKDKEVEALRERTFFFFLFKDQTIQNNFSVIH